MWLFLMNMLSNPLRSLRTWVVGIGVGVILLLALANADQAMQSLLGGILGLLVMAVVLIRVPMRIAGSLMIAAIVIVSALSLVQEVMASGYLPLAVVGVVVAVPLWMGRGLLGRVVHRPPPSRGARFATLRDLRRAGFLTSHGYPLGTIGKHVIRLPENRETEGVLVTAATGAGKSSILVKPALIWETKLPPGKRRSWIVLDPKDELTQDTMATLARTHRVLLWDPSRPDECTVGFNPLASLPGPNDEGFVGAVKQLAQAWFWCTRGGEQTTDPFWVNQPRSVMESLFLAFVVGHPDGTFVELADWARSLTVAAFQAALDHTAHPAVRASAETLRSLGMSDKTIGPIMSDVLQRFDVLDDPRVRRSMTGPPVDSSFVEQPTVLYLRVGAQEAQRLAPLLSMALNQMYGELTKIAARDRSNRLPRPVRVIVDEFGTLPRILNLEIALATFRSMGVGHYMLVQSSSQLVHAYGRELAATIQDNLCTKVILGGAGTEDAQAFSQRCGEITEYRASRSWNARGPLGAGSISHTAERRPLVSVSDIVHLGGEVLVSTRGIPPFRVTAQPYYRDPATMRMLEADKRAFAQHTATGPAPKIAAPTPPPDAASRDVPPPGCSDQDWNAAAASLRVARWSMEDDLLGLVTGRMTDLDQVRARWRMNPSRSSPARYAKITVADRAKSPAVAAYVDELALRLELRNEDEPTA